ncbi:MAG: flagellar biosynthesis protein FliQ [Acetobacterales bacterium]
MDEAQVLDVGRDAVATVIKMGGPIMMAGLVTGLIISLFQSLTQINEMTLTFVPKILVIFASVLLLLPYMLRTLDAFTLGLFDKIIALG